MFCESKNLSALVTPREEATGKDHLQLVWQFYRRQACEQLILNLSHSSLSLDYNTDWHLIGLCFYFGFKSKIS